MKRYLRPLLIVLVVLIGANFWQSRKMPRGEAPVAVVTPLGSDLALHLPEKSGSVELLYFFAPWCGVCSISAPNATTVGNLIPNVKVRFIALDFSNVEEVSEFVRLNLKGDVYLGDALVRQAWSVEAYPSYAIIGSSGKISHVAVGYSTVVGMAFHVLLAQLGV